MNKLASKIYWLLLGLLLLNFSVRADTSTPPTNPYQGQINTVNQVMANLTNPNYAIQPTYVPSAVQSVIQQFMKGFNAVFSARMTNNNPSSPPLSQPIAAPITTAHNTYTAQQSAMTNNTPPAWNQTSTGLNSNPNSNQQPPILSGFNN